MYFFSDIPDPASETPLPDYQHQQKTNSCPTETSSVLSVNTTTSSNVSLAVSHNSSSENSSTLSSNSNSKSSRNVKSAIHGKSIPPTRNNVRASTAKAKKPLSPNLPKDREQGILIFIFTSIVIVMTCVFFYFSFDRW